jgi:hypothetical protein
MEDSAFMNDKDLVSNKSVIDADIAKIKATRKTVVLPKDGLGTGLAKLKEKAPQTYAYLKQRLLQEFGFNNDEGTLSTTISSKKGYTQLKDGVVYKNDLIKSDMLEKMGYTPQEIGNILKNIC